MKTIVESNPNISKLWGRQKPKTDKKYRLMKYVIVVEHDGKTALHNNVTGQLVLLNENEVHGIELLPKEYCSDFDKLIEDHFLVPLEYDEHKQVLNIRCVLKKSLLSNERITHYTILPTTACNARCYYCFEQGTKMITMTEEIADDVVKFIVEHCGEQKKVFITWFGGEPTVADKRIDQICLGLQSEGIEYSSNMYTNGYLMDECMCKKARELWHLVHVQMSVDGTEEIYNKVKAYVNANDNPYRRVVRNIGYMLEQNIGVSVRMNVDYINYHNFKDLMSDFQRHYGDNDLFNLCAYALIGEYVNHDGVIEHADENWISEKVEELNILAYENGLMKPSTVLPHLALNACSADNNLAIVIGADGKLVRCAEQSQEKSVGTITEGITDAELMHKWQKTIESEKCFDCAFYPNCIQLERCSGAGHCYKQGKNQQYIWNIQRAIKCH